MLFYYKSISYLWCHLVFWCDFFVVKNLVLCFLYEWCSTKRKAPAEFRLNSTNEWMGFSLSIMILKVGEAVLQGSFLKRFSLFFYITFSVNTNWDFSLFLSGSLTIIIFSICADASSLIWADSSLRVDITCL